MYTFISNRIEGLVTVWSWKDKSGFGHVQPPSTRRILTNDKRGTDSKQLKIHM